MGNEQRQPYNAETIYQNLESTMVKYKDLRGVPVRENNEGFVSLTRFGIPNGYLPIMADMEAITGHDVFVREGIAERLLQAQGLLQKSNQNYSLYVVYGYRSLEVQTKKFLEQLRNTTDRFFTEPDDMYEEAHRFIAVPTVAGHPTGGAVDVLISDRETGEFIDFGGEYCDFSTKNCYTFFPEISEKARTNRFLLRQVVTQVGFAPFDGEWWHFSYGDREWAYYYGKKNASYEQKLLEKGGFI